MRLSRPSFDCRVDAGSSSAEFEDIIISLFENLGKFKSKFMSNEETGAFSSVRCCKRCLELLRYPAPVNILAVYSLLVTLVSIARREWFMSKNKAF